MAKTVVNLSDQMAVFVQKANLISTHVGDLVTLNTSVDSDIVGAVNEIELNHNNLDSNVGTLASLTTTDKSDLVSAINEIKASAVATDSSLSGFLRSDQADIKTAGNLNFADNVKATFGDSNDLEIYHNGSSSFIADVGTGNLTLLANEFRLNNSGNTENMITAAPDGAVTLFHNDSAKIATSSTGATITGATVTASGGSASAPAYAVTSGSLGANGLFVPAANTLGFSAAGTERMRVDASGRLGIKNTSPDANLHVSADEANFIARFTNDGNNVNREGIFVQTGTDDGSGTNVFFAAYDGDGSETGQLRSVSGTFQLTDTSDERLKQDIVDTTVSGLTSVNSMKVRDFAYKRNPTQTIKAGFVAQELQTVFSSAVSYSESDDDKILSVSRERLVPVLVKAIQELSAKNDALEARITALEAE